MRNADRLQEILSWFQNNMPAPQTELNYDNPFQLLVAVILSAQCTDKRVNLVTPDLFAAFPTPQKLAEAGQSEIFEYIRSISYPNNKARHLAGMAQMLLDDFNGKIPEEPQDLQRLPGVGRKTANVIASVIFHHNVIAVDTHVFRVAARLGFTSRARTPLEAEKQLMKRIPVEMLAVAHHWFILHGRYICLARRPQCLKCPIYNLCRWKGKPALPMAIP